MHQQGFRPDEIDAVLSSTALSRRGFLGSAAGLLATSVLGCGGGRPPGRQPPPNIVLMMADDLGREVLGCYGGSSYETPNLDALAAQGTRFEHCYATPMCTPSRVQMMTGCYPFRSGWTTLRRDMPDDTTTLDPTRRPLLPTLMREAGYETLVTGKWQLGWLGQQPDHPTRCGFDHHYLWDRQPRTGSNVSRHWRPNVIQNGQVVETTRRDYGPDLFQGFLLDFLKRPRPRPFFALHSMILPHGPYTPPPGIDATYRQRRRTDDPAYFDEMVRYMDQQVGRLMQTLEAQGLRDNTLVLFTGDNGSPPIAESRFAGRVVRGAKHTLTDLGIRVPLIAALPGVVPAGRACGHLVDFSDLLPTCVELGGGRLPTAATFDGRSFAAQLRGSDRPTREWVYSQYDDDRCLRTRRWKLFAKGKLFDMRRDPWEEHPLDAATATGDAAEAVRRLRPILAQMQ